MYEFLEYRVQDVMTKDPVVVDRKTPLSEIQDIFRRHAFNGLPVVEPGNRLVGVVTKLDVLKAFLFSPKSMIPPYAEILRLPAERVTSWQPLTAEPDEPLTRVLQRMVHTRCKSFPVVRGEKLVGVVSREDILAGLLRAAAGERPRESAA